MSQTTRDGKAQRVLNSRSRKTQITLTRIAKRPQAAWHTHRETALIIKADNKKARGKILLLTSCFFILFCFFSFISARITLRNTDTFFEKMFFLFKEILQFKGDFVNNYLQIRP